MGMAVTATDELSGLLANLVRVARPLVRPDEQVTIRLLTKVARAGRRGASQREIALGLAIGDAYVSRLCDHLEAQGLIVRESHPNDRRVKVLRLTALGELQLALCARATGTIMEAALSNFSPEELDLLFRVIDRLAESAPPRFHCEGCQLGGC